MPGRGGVGRAWGGGRSDLGAGAGAVRADVAGPAGEGAGAGRAHLVGEGEGAGVGRADVAGPPGASRSVMPVGAGTGRPPPLPLGGLRGVVPVTSDSQGVRPLASVPSARAGLPVARPLPAPRSSGTRAGPVRAGLGVSRRGRSHPPFPPAPSSAAPTLGRRGGEQVGWLPARSRKARRKGCRCGRSRE